MSAIDPTQARPMTGLGRPFNVATDLSKRAFVDEDLSLYELFMTQLRQGRSTIDGITFTGCRVEGPAVMLVLTGTTFEGVNFGESKGDIGNLVLRPVRNMAIGAIPVVGCAFLNCEFYGLGFTGSESIVNEILAIRTAG